MGELDGVGLGTVMLERSFRPRGSRRVVPRKSVTLALYEDADPLAYGVIINLSENGACFASGAPFQPGARCFLKVSFYGQPELFETWARVVWREEGYKLSGYIRGLQVHGVEFTRLTEVERLKLERQLRSGDFEVTSAPAFSDFEEVKSELSDVLDRLGSKLQKATGSSD